MSEQTTYGYLIAIRDGAEIRGPVKVGVSSNPTERLRSLQTACPLELVLVKRFSYPNREMAMQMEAAFHATQAKHRVRGEWFDLKPTFALAIMTVHVRWIISSLELSADEKRAAFDLCMGTAGE